MFLTVIGALTNLPDDDDDDDDDTFTTIHRMIEMTKTP